MATIDTLNIKIKAEIEYRKYMLVFFPVATFSKADDVEMLTVFGVTVYAKAGNAINVLGYTWVRNNDR